MFPDTFKNLPNVHVNLHLPQHARNFATLRNTAVGTKEMFHRVFKGLVPHTNRKNLELDLVRRYNTLQALRFIVDGGEDSRFPGRRSHITEIVLDNCISQLLSGWYAMDIDSINNDIAGKENGGLFIIITHFI